MKKQRDKALVGYKTCPRCEGTGQIPCDGREYYQQLSKEWADSLHGRMVMVPFLRASSRETKGDWIQLPGLAIRTKARGGWYGVKIYISVDKAPNWGKFNLQLYGYDEDHDIVNGHKLYYRTKGRPQSKDVIPMDVDTVVPELKEIMRLVQ